MESTNSTTIAIPYTEIKNPYCDESGNVIILLSNWAGKSWFLSGKDQTPNPIGYDKEVVELFLGREKAFDNDIDRLRYYVKLFSSSLRDMDEDHLWRLWRHGVRHVPVKKNYKFGVYDGPFLKETVQYLHDLSIIRVNG